MPKQLKAMSGYDCRNKLFFFLPFLTKLCEWWGRLDFDRWTAPKSWAGSSKWAIADSNM